jgi:hypothetical protein
MYKIVKDYSDYSNIPPNQIKKAMSLTNMGFKLLIYMYSKAGSWEFSNSEVRSVIHATERSYADAVRELKREGWLLIDRTGKVKTYYIGLDTVAKYKEALSR